MRQFVNFVGDCPEFRVWFGQNGNEGALPWPDARNPRFPTPSSTNFWLGPIRRRAIILWNTVYLGRAVDELRAAGEIIPDELLAHIAPLGWEHIAFNGDYVWPAQPKHIPTPEKSKGDPARRCLA